VEGALTRAGRGATLNDPRAALLLAEAVQSGHLEVVGVELDV